jgi:hypothetical protein
MTPKEKARELIINNQTLTMDMSEVRKRAIYGVDLILTVLNELPEHSKDYWKEVKKELCVK